MSKIEYFLIFVLVVILLLILWALFGTFLQETWQSFLTGITQP